MKRVIATAMLLGIVGSACSPDPAGLALDLPEPASALPQFFHGNCFAGWSVAVAVRARETTRADVFLASLVYRIWDRGGGLEVVSETLDAAALDTRYGSRASILLGGSTRTFRLSGIAQGRPVGPIVLSGELSGRDENGFRVAAAFELEAPLIVAEPDPPGGGGACSVP